MTLYSCIQRPGPLTRAVIAERGIPTMPIIFDSSFDLNADGIISAEDEARLRRRVPNIVPLGWTGPVCGNWEDPYRADMVEVPWLGASVLARSSPTYPLLDALTQDVILAWYFRGAEIVKAARNCALGWWGLPKCRMVGPDDPHYLELLARVGAWTEANMDWHIISTYSDEPGDCRERFHTYVSRLVTAAPTVPTMLMTRPRYVNPAKPAPACALVNQAIPLNEFVDHVAACFMAAPWAALALFDGIPEDATPEVAAELDVLHASRLEALV